MRDASGDCMRDVIAFSPRVTRDPKRSPAFRKKSSDSRGLPSPEESFVPSVGPGSSPFDGILT